MADDLLPSAIEELAHIVSPSSQHTHTIVFLHGRDSTAMEFASELFESQGFDNRTLLDTFPGFKWVFPNAGELPSARFDSRMSQWFDMWSVENPNERPELQRPGLRHSVIRVLQVLRQEAQLISPRRIMLAGISQGCAVAIYALLCTDLRLGGFVGMSSWLSYSEPVQDIVESERDSAARLGQVREELVGLPDHESDAASNAALLETPILLSHSEDDEVVSFSNGEILRDTLTNLGMNVQWHLCRVGGHWLNEPEGVDDIVAFVARCCNVGEDKSVV